MAENHSTEHPTKTANRNLVTPFVCGLRTEQLSRHTVEAYERDVWVFLSFLAKSPLEATRADIRAFLVDRMNTVDPRSASRSLSALRHFYRFLLSEELMDKNPTFRIPVPKIAKTIPKALPSGEIDAMVNSLDDSPLGLRNKAMILTAFGSGLRVSELICLKLDCLHPSESFLTVRQGKFSKDRIAPLNPRTIAALKLYLEKSRPTLCRKRETPYVFVGRWGTAPMTRHNFFTCIRKLAKDALGKTISPHWLRHSFGTALVAGGADLRAVQVMMGHVDIDHTQVYIHLDMGTLRSIHQAAHPAAKR